MIPFLSSISASSSCHLPLSLEPFSRESPTFEGRWGLPLSPTTSVEGLHNYSTLIALGGVIECFAGTWLIYSPANFIMSGDCISHPIDYNYITFVGYLGLLSAAGSDFIYRGVSKIHPKYQTNQ